MTNNFKSFTEVATAPVVSATDAAAALHLAGRAKSESAASIDKAKIKADAAEALLIVGASDAERYRRTIEFGITGKDEADVHDHCQLSLAEFTTRDQLPFMRNGAGAVSKIAQGKAKAAINEAVFGKGTPATWTMLNRAMPLVDAIVSESMTAELQEGALVLTGGTSERAEKMRNAKSLSALRKAVGVTASGKPKGDASRGTGEGESEGEANPAPKPANPSDITRDALKIAKAIAAGKETACSATMENLLAIAKAIASAPDAFADD